MIVAAAVNVRAQLYQHAGADATLTAMLPNGAASILPRPRIDPNQVARPFVWLRYEGGGPVGEAAPDLGVWAFEIHDKPVMGFVAIDEIVARLKWIFNGATWEPATSGLPAYWSQWAGASGELLDTGFQTAKRIARIQVFAS